MSSKTNMKSKKVNREKNILNGKDGQMVLLRDEISQILMIVEAAKVSSVGKVSKLAPGITATWQNNSRERWRSQILHIGTESDCSKVLNTIEKNIESRDTNVSESKKHGKHKLQSTITIEPKSVEPIQMNEDEKDENEQQLHILDEHENEQELKLSLPATTDISTSMLYFCLSVYQYLYLVSTISYGSKRSSEESFYSSNKQKKSKHGLTVSYLVYPSKEQECLALQAQVATHKQEWMRK
ncbi:unnamed protein product [Rotaria sp. Silwood2]|nr:unnamed protein product [Rotaria sp. Silwood2]CAF3539367.1 unnamed protein product [Rotaria sp. Silwood2]CAF4429708.1 unnamed protein product [Rotaria sp. Silwood2]CAF4512414.1 unnamed protein product [Rotaria sp. Silwood2]